MTMKASVEVRKQGISGLTPTETIIAFVLIPCKVPLSRRVAKSNVAVHKAPADSLFSGGGKQLFNY